MSEEPQRHGGTEAGDIDSTELLLGSRAVLQIERRGKAAASRAHSKTLSRRAKPRGESNAIGFSWFFSAALRLCVSYSFVAISLASSLLPARAESEHVGPVPESVRKEFKLAAFYQKHLNLDGLPIVGSTNVSDYALLEAAWIVRHMLTNRSDILHAMASNHVRLAVMAWNEFTTDVPEHSRLTSKTYWDRRARGLGATPDAPAISCAEENLLCFPGDPYAKENILVHEFGHTIHEMALVSLDPTFDQRLRLAFRAAKRAGRWTNTYAATDHKEYWAEGTQSWFDNNRANDSAHNDINTRAKLKQYDPALAALCAEVYGDGPWRYHKPMERAPEDRAHLAGFDPSHSPHFKWREAPLGDHAKVSLHTDLGDIQVELYPAKAPETVRNFLRYVREGFYSDGVFHRTVTLDNQPDNSIKIEVVQAAANPERQKEAFPAVAIERTRDTGLRHLAGTLSMARDGPDSATHEFFICLTDQPELDFGGKRNPDGQGFAAFGKVISGMEVVRKIQASPASGQTLTPPVRIKNAIQIE
jgi:cyclophilin family peptidyl-prolyl cis-trans isomerase